MLEQVELLTRYPFLVIFIVIPWMFGIWRLLKEIFPNSKADIERLTIVKNTNPESKSLNKFIKIELKKKGFSCATGLGRSEKRKKLIKLYNKVEKYFRWEDFKKIEKYIKEFGLKEKIGTLKVYAKYSIIISVFSLISLCILWVYVSNPIQEAFQNDLINYYSFTMFIFVIIIFSSAIAINNVYKLRSIMKYDKLIDNKE